MRKKIVYITGILALGVVIFNNIIQLSEIIKTNQDYFIGLIIAMIASIIYGILNIK